MFGVNPDAALSGLPPTRPDVSPRHDLSLAAADIMHTSVSVTLSCSSDMLGLHVSPDHRVFISVGHKHGVTLLALAESVDLYRERALRIIELACQDLANGSVGSVDLDLAPLVDGGFMILGGTYTHDGGERVTP